MRNLLRSVQPLLSKTSCTTTEKIISVQPNKNNLCFDKMRLLFSLVLLMILPEMAWGQSQTFNYTGSSQTFTVPAGVSSVTVVAWGGGGSGADRNGLGTRYSGGGGGGGGYQTYIYTGLSAGNTFTITIGNGGVRGINSGNGVSTTVVRSGLTDLVASGGMEGSDGTSSAPGAGGAGGGTGSGPSGSTGTAGFDGSAGNSSGAGGNGGNGATATGGAGGAGAADGTNNDAGTAIVPGGGGGGANNDNNSDPSSGAHGQVTITWTCTGVDLNPFGTAATTVCPNRSSTITITANDLVTGTYDVYYTLTGNNVTASPQLASMNFNGTSKTGTFSTIALINPGTTTIRILSVGCAVTTTANTATINVTNVLPGTISKGNTNPGPGCGSLNPNSTVNTDGGTGASYRWDQSTNGGTNWSAVTPSATSNTYDIPNITQTTQYRRARIQGSCEVYSNVLEYIVGETLTITTAATTAVVAAVCQSASSQSTTMAYTATTGSPTSYSINWTTAGISDQGTTAFAFVAGGGNINNITVPAGTAANTYLGTMTIANASGCTATRALTLTVNALPIITIPPSGVLVLAGASTSFSVTATGATSYQWQLSTNGGGSWSNVFNGGVYSNATTAVLNISNASGLNGTQYHCLLTNSCGTTISAAAVLSIDKDTDGDGIPDSSDLDDDNDGITDCAEKGLDVLTVGNAFVISGNATVVSSNEIQLTPNSGYQIGTAMYANKIDFGSSFNFSFDAYLGNNNGGADGIAIIFHNDPRGANAIGANGEGMGASGIQNGIALEIDTYQNTNQGDPIEDHGCIWETADIATRLTTPISLNNMEDGAWHTVAVSWNASSNTIMYSVDGIIAGQYTDDLITDFFGGSSAVYFGFSAATGGATNVQSVRFSNFCNLPAIVDTDIDGIPDNLDLDSDGDGCFDATEAGFLADQNGHLKGTGGVDANGLVVGYTSGYTAPANGDGNSVFDFQQQGTAPSITSQPANRSICATGNTSFTVVGSNANTYQWQVSLNSGGSWADLTNSGIYSGVTTAILTLTNVTASYNGYWYRSIVSNNSYACTVLTSNNATLDVNAGTPSVPGAISGNTTQCSGLTNQIYSIVPITGATTYTWAVPSGWTITSGEGSTSINVTTGAAGNNGNITVTAGNSCGTSTASSLAVTVRPVFTTGAINIIGETICYNGDPSVIGSSTDASGGDGTITYNWQANGVDIPTSNSETYNPPSGVTANTTYTRWAKDNTCNTAFTQSSGSWAVTVTPNNTITLSSSVGTDSQTKCISTSITNITYSTTGATGATITGLPAGVTGSWSGNVATISGTPTVSGSFNYIVTTTGGCGSTTANGTITVTPNNTITLSSAVGTDSQTKCINTAITNITYSTTGATGATITGLPAGVIGSWSGNVATISGTPTVSGSFNYIVTTTGGCGSTTANGTITVAPNNTVVLSSAADTDSQTKCINMAITNITYSTTGATGATITGLPAGVTGSWSGNVVTISGTPTASGSFNYTVTTTGGCGGPTANGTIGVTPNNTITLSSAVGTDSQTKCINTAITNITYSTTGATGATITGLPAGVTGSWSGNVVTISGIPSTTTGSPFTYTITLTGGCGTVNTTGTITVQDINASVSDASASSSGSCPDFYDFNGNTDGYRAGYTILKFQVLRELSTSAWSFDYTLLGGTLYSGSPESASATKNVIAGSSSVDLIFYIANTPGAAQTIEFKVINVRDTNCTNNGINRTVSHSISAMPAIGSFN